MTHPVRILSISDDDGLRMSRELLLRSRGYETESMTSNDALCQAVSCWFEIVLICRSVDPELALAVAHRMRNANPSIQLLCIAPVEGQSTRGGLELPAGPEPLLEAIRTLCEQMPDGHAGREVSQGTR